MAVTESSGNGYALYMGAKMPNVESVWDKKIYPYATMLVSSEGTMIYLSSVPGVATDPSLCWKSATIATFVLGDGGWNNSEVLTGDIAVGVSDYYPLWANYDIIDTSNNSVAITASDPIALDGYTVIEWDGDTTGLPSVKSSDFTRVRIADFVLPTSAVFAIPMAMVAEDFQTEVLELSDTTINQWVIRFPATNDTNWVYANDTPVATFTKAGIWCVSYNEQPCIVAYTTAATEEEETDLKPFFMRNNGKWVKMTAYQRIDGAWVLISKAKESELYFYGRVANEDETPDVYIGDTGYVGAVLPNINTVWTDKETYPYAVIFTSEGVICIMLSSVQLYTSPNDLYFQSKGSLPIYGLVDGEYILSTTLQFDEYGSIGETANTVWTNSDILDGSDSTTYLSATDPIPVSGIVGYSYNGTVLPELPEYDESVYPYAFIFSSIFGVQLFVLSEWEYLVETVGDTAYEFISLLCDYKTFLLIENEWSEQAYEGEKVTINNSFIIWTNEDIICQGAEHTPAGDIYLAASDPIPVYE